MDKEIAELSERAREDAKAYPKKRFVFAQIARYLPQRIFIALVGPRGAGKTIILKQILLETKNCIYISLDTQKPENGIFSFAKQAEEEGVKLLLLDEVHAYPGFEMEIKKISDFLKINVAFTSSSSISLHDSSYDLSRRIRPVYVPPFSLREFIYFEKNESIPPLSFEGLLSETAAKEYYGNTIHSEALFERYLQFRNYPFALGKTDLPPIFRNMLETIINRDIILTGRATPQEAMDMRRLMAFIANSPVENMSYTTIAKNLNITRYKAEKYCELFEKAFVLKRVRPKGTNVLQEPKILLALPYRLLYKNYRDCIGHVREDFFTDSMKFLGFGINYLKSERGRKTPDYVIDDAVIEVGGIGKSPSQFKGYPAKKRIILTHPGKIDALCRPLYMAGMLEKSTM